jgi:hypothetical protein
MAKINDLDALDHIPEGIVDPAQKPDAESPRSDATDEPIKEHGTPSVSAAARVFNRNEWYRTLGLAEPLMQALASSPGMLASEKHFSQAAEQLSESVQSAAKIMNERGKIPLGVATMVAAPLCAASWQLQAEQGKSPVIDARRIANIAIRFNVNMGDKVEFPVRQLPHIARKLVEDPAAPALLGTNFRDTLHGMASVFSAETGDWELRNTEKADIGEAHEYFIARLAAFSPEHIGESIQAAKEYMNFADKNGIKGWHTLAFWGNSAKDERAREMLSLALATQIAIGDDWYQTVQQKNPELCKILVNMGRKENIGLVAKAAREYADRVEYGAHMDLGETEKLASVMCTAMREGMNFLHDSRKKIFDATQRMLEKKYPEAKTEQAMREAMKKEDWGARVKSAYQSAKTLREGIFSSIREDVGAMELSVSMKIRAAVGTAMAPLLKPANARILATAFPFIPKDSTPDAACVTVLDWGEKAVRGMAGATVAALDIPDLDRPKMQGRIEKFLQEVLKNTDVVKRCAKQGKSAEIFPEMVKELRTVIQTVAGMLPVHARENCIDRLEDLLLDAQQDLCNEFRAASVQQESHDDEQGPGMENEAAKRSSQPREHNKATAREEVA